MPVLLTLPTFIIATWRLASIKGRGFGPQDMLWLTIIFFFVVSPIQSIKEYGFLGGTTFGMRYELESFLLAEGIVTTSVLIIAIFDNKRRATHSPGRKVIPDDQVAIILALSILCFIAYVQSSAGLSTVLLPRRNKSREDVFILRLGFLAILTVGTMLLAANRRPWSLLSKISFVCNSLLLLICVNPLNSPRFFFLASWFPVFILLTKDKLKFVPVFVGILFGVLVYMPLASLTSRRGLEGISLLRDSQYASDILRLKDMDVFDTLVHACSMMRDEAFMLGKNTAAIVLFFVPRAIWPEKPIVGGLIVGDDLYNNWYAGTHNLSFYVGGDFYMDLGLLGVLIGFLCIGFLWKRAINSNLLIVDGCSVFTAVLAGSLPILIRGPLGAVIGYFFCLTLACLIYRVILRFRIARSSPHTNQVEPT